MESAPAPTSKSYRLSLGGLASCKDSPLRQQKLDIFPSQVTYETVFRTDDRVSKVSLGLLQLQYFLFDRVAGNQAIGKNLALLTDAMRAVYSLSLDSGVPPRVENEDIVGCGEVQTHAPSLQADKEQRAIRR